MKIYYVHYVQFLELASITIETNAKIKTIIPKIGTENCASKWSSIIRKSICVRLRKGKTFVRFNASRRLFNEDPLVASQGIHSLIKWKEFDI